LHLLWMVAKDPTTRSALKAAQGECAIITAEMHHRIKDERYEARAHQAMQWLRGELDA
jgi:hypothetical protein